MKVSGIQMENDTSSDSGNLPYAESFRDLVVYQKARSLQARSFAISQTFPAEEKFALTNQIRRSSRSIGAQIAQAWAKRRYEKHFVSKLTDALGEANETEHWIETALADGYIDETTNREILGLAQEIEKMLHGMIRKSDRFCSENPPGKGVVRDECRNFVYREAARFPTH